LKNGEASAFLGGAKVSTREKRANGVEVRRLNGRLSSVVGRRASVELGRLGGREKDAKSPLATNERAFSRETSVERDVNQST
jgi:hypothetical protein